MVGWTQLWRENYVGCTQLSNQPGTKNTPVTSLRGELLSMGTQRISKSKRYNKRDKDTNLYTKEATTSQSYIHSDSTRCSTTCQTKINLKSNQIKLIFTNSSTSHHKSNQTNQLTSIGISTNHSTSHHKSSFSVFSMVLFLVHPGTFHSPEVIASVEATS